MRRLSNEQYRRIIADVFGPHITVAGEADALLRTDGLRALGARTARITPSGFDKFYAMARSIAQQVVSPDNRASQLPCAPAGPSAPDDACAGEFFTDVGQLLYRRPDAIEGSHDLVSLGDGERAGDGVVRSHDQVVEKFGVALAFYRTSEARRVRISGIGPWFL